MKLVRSLRGHPIRLALIGGSLWLFTRPYLDRPGREMLAALMVWALFALIVWYWDR